ncbi:unnamed protein product [Adineta steineri]|uniref:Pyrroloquinoline quinone-dependent pyranose dehydrogenase beta-propeller domain-containing protein n=1 Tax=Adineta steineri TaxID=433720 RepID=A0A815LU84_9BILA|nr:unnamed protein product [Adineta steineri]CAF3842599.1 unnamed protein product [Adineta steineri]
MQFFIYFFFIIINSLQQIRTENITFVPKPITITVSELPAPNANESVTKRAQVIPVPADPKLYVPEGFTVKLYFANLTSPRYLIYTPSGDILVSESAANRISCLVDTDNDGNPDERITFADATNGLNRPFGMVFINNFFYVGNQDAVRRYPWVTGSRKIEGTGEVIMTYGSAGHWTRTVVMPPSADKLFVSIGSASNVDVEDLPRASIQQVNFDGTNNKTFASGLRNSIGLAFHPVTNELYVACQERDRIGDNLVPDFFTRVQENEFYGWPYAYLSSTLIDPRRRFENGTSERPDLVSKTRTPDVLFQAHSAVLDMRFYTNTQFPDRYRNGAFAALHGSWNKNEGTGYKIVFIPFNKDTNRPLGSYEDFIYGFLTDPSGPLTYGRPVGLLVLKDGSLLFSDDGNHRLYQVQYNSTTSSGQIYFISMTLIFICAIFSI